jgi:hypothetical protein
MVKENGMEVMRKKESVNQSINLSENFASWLMMIDDAKGLCRRCSKIPSEARSS